MSIHHECGLRGSVVGTFTPPNNRSAVSRAAPSESGALGPWNFTWHRLDSFRQASKPRFKECLFGGVLGRLFTTEHE